MGDSDAFEIHGHSDKGLQPVPPVLEIIAVLLCGHEPEVASVPACSARGGSMRRTFIAALCFSTLTACKTPPVREEPGPWPPVATFSILAMDSATGDIGGAVQSRVFSVGNGVLWAEAGVGAVATQAIVDVSYGPQAITLLKQGMSAEQVVKQVWNADPDPRPTRSEERRV